MKDARRVDREARQMFRLCVVNGRLDDDRVRQTVVTAIRAHRRRGIAVLSRFHRLVRLDRSRHTAIVESAAPLPSELRTRIDAALRGTYGDSLAVEYTTEPALIGGVCITVDSDVYDSSLRGGLAALAARFDVAAF